MNTKNLLAVVSAFALTLSSQAMAETAALPLLPDLKTAKAAAKADDHAKAAAHWMPLAHRGNPEAQVELGKLYSKGLGVRQDHKIALNLFSAAAKQGDARAMYELGRAYESGNGVPQNALKAKDWYDLSAASGYARGDYAIGQMYEKQKFIEQPKINHDSKETIRLAINDIKDGDFSKAEMIGDLFARGQGIPKDMNRAYIFYTLAGAEEKAKQIEPVLSLDHYLGARDSVALLKQYDDKTVRDQHRALINELKRLEAPTLPPDVIEHQQTLATQYYQQAAQYGYIPAENTTDNKDSTATRRTHRVTGDVRMQYLGEENLDLGTRSDDLETAAVVNARAGLYLFPTDTITTYAEVRGLFSDGLASSNTGDDEDARDISFVELRQIWVEFDKLFGNAPLSATIGRQRFREDRALWWNRDLDAVRLGYDTTLTNGFIAVGQNLDQYRIGDDNDLGQDEKDRLRLLGELSHDYQTGHRLEGRFLYEDDHSGQDAIGALVPSEDRDNEDFNLLWAGIRAKGKQDLMGYRLDLIGVYGEEDITSTGGTANPALRQVTGNTSRDVMGWAFDGSVDYQFDTLLEPTVTFGYAYGSGDDGNGDNSAFRQSDLEGNTSIFPDLRVTNSLRNYGEVLRPQLSNLHILNGGVTVPVLNASDASLNYFSYWLDEKTGALRDADISAPLNGQDSHVGQAADLSVNFNIGKEMNLTQKPLEDVSLRLKFGGFKAGDAYGSEEGEYAFRGSSEVRIRF